jgi:N-acetylglucosamine kinase-like BadF-type ATPase
MAYFLGVDAGGTKTEFLLGDERAELGRVRTGSIKRLRRDAETAARNLESGLTELSSLTGVPLLSVTRCCVGAAGVTVPLVTDWIRAAFRPVVGGELLVVGDVEVAHDAAFRGGRGVLVLAGTGSQVVGRAEDGRMVTAGGWGPVLSDEGSGYFLGLDGLRRAFRAIDEGRSTTLLDAIREHWGLATLDDLVGFANLHPTPDFSELAPLVAAHAAEGDVVAMEVVRHGGSELAALAQLAIERIRRAEGAQDHEFTAPPIALAGSVLDKVAGVREALSEALLGRYPGAKIFDTPVDPVQGALWRAREGLATIPAN